MSQAEHAAMDWLYPMLAAVSALEIGLLSEPLPLPHAEAMLCIVKVRCLPCVTTLCCWVLAVVACPVARAGKMCSTSSSLCDAHLDN